MTTEKNRLTVQASMEDHKLELATAAANAWLADQDKRERERVKPQMEFDRIFAKINAKAADSRQSVTVQGIEVPTPARNETVGGAWLGAFGVLSFVVVLALSVAAMMIM